jgi:hypothetical protein
VKLLGRKIGYKALETRLKQMWVRNGIINIVDIGNDFFLVTFTSREDHYRALIDGPWMIYDNYLVVREWSPNFHPSGEVIEKVAVWVRFSGLPIEYYDNKMLHFIGNRIGRTVKVDRTTQSQARGKYARLCVEVDLTKPLLAMFQIKDRYYKVEYEGLHMLCLACGTFGHYKEGCVAKVNNTVWNGEQTTENARKEGPVNTSSVQEGPWQVVQKTRRPRKKVDGGKIDGTLGNETTKKTGSRYAILQENIPDLEEEVIGDSHDDSMVIVTTKDTQNHAKSSGLRKGMESVKRNIGGDYKVELVKNKTTTSTNHGSTSTPSTREHQQKENPRSSKKVRDYTSNNNECMEEDTNQNITSGANGGVTNMGVNNQAEVLRIEESLSQPNMVPRHYIRPPDIITGSLKSRPVLQKIDEVDAPENHVMGVNRDFIDTTMELVEETPVSAQGDAREVSMTLDQ